MVELPSSKSSGRKTNWGDYGAKTCCSPCPCHERYFHSLKDTNTFKNHWWNLSSLFNLESAHLWFYPGYIYIYMYIHPGYTLDHAAKSMDFCRVCQWAYGEHTSKYGLKPGGKRWPWGWIRRYWTPVLQFNSKGSMFQGSVDYDAAVRQRPYRHRVFLMYDSVCGHRMGTRLDGNQEETNRNLSKLQT